MAGSFRKKFLEVSSGTLLAQILSVALMPIVTRLYLPENLGEYALSVSIYSIVAIAATLRLEMSIMIARDDDQARVLSWLAILSSILVAGITFVVLVSWRELDAFALWTAVAVAVTGVVQTLANWLSRMEKFRTLATRNVLEKLLVLLLGLGFGFWGYTRTGLIVSQVLGLLLAAAYLAWSSGLRLPRAKRGLWLKTVKEFADFPAKNILSSLFLAMAIFLPSLLFARHFVLADLGQYNLTARLFEVPISLVGFAFSTVYFQHLAKNSASQRKSSYGRTTRLLLLVFGPPLLLVGAFGTQLFSVVFGSAWATAGSLAIWLAPYALARLIYVSQYTMLLVQRRLTLELVLSLLLFASQVGGFYLGLHLGGSVISCVQWMSILGTVTYVAGAAAIFLIL